MTISVNQSTMFSVSSNCSETLISIVNTLGRYEKELHRFYNETLDYYNPLPVLNTFNTSMTNTYFLDSKQFLIEKSDVPKVMGLVLASRSEEAMKRVLCAHSCQGSSNKHFLTNWAKIIESISDIGLRLLYVSILNVHMGHCHWNPGQQSEDPNQDAWDSLRLAFRNRAAIKNCNQTESLRGLLLPELTPDETLKLARIMGILSRFVPTESIDLRFLRRICPSDLLKKQSNLSEFSKILAMIFSLREFMSKEILDNFEKAQTCQEWQNVCEKKQPNRPVFSFKDLLGTITGVLALVGLGWFGLKKCYDRPPLKQKKVDASSESDTMILSLGPQSGEQQYL